MSEEAFLFSSPSYLFAICAAWSEQREEQYRVGRYAGWIATLPHTKRPIPILSLGKFGEEENKPVPVQTELTEKQKRFFEYTARENEKLNGSKSG